ncbi:MAG: hypothetical protein O0V67_09690, partial [Methanocorpusculum sp.]|nr:hypothetical protein [Methanocorpusculum sp.]
MRVYCAQIAQVWNDPAIAFTRAEEAVLHAVGEGADLVLFSEQYATGWRSSADAGLPGFSGAEVKARWCSLAKEHRVAVAGSYAREVPGTLPQNVMLVAGPDGDVLAEYAKMHLFTPGGEDLRYSAGTEPVCFSYGGVKFGCAVCFDLRFPELFRAYLHAGCACVLVQAAWPAARVADWELLLRARALENRGFVAGCGCLGYDAACGVDYSGRSLVCDYEGRIVADAGVFAGGCCSDVDVEGGL